MTSGVTNRTVEPIRNHRTQAAKKAERSLVQMATGNRASGVPRDVAEFSVSSRFDARVRRMDAALSNVGNAMSRTQIQAGFMKRTQKTLDRMGELAILAQDVTKSVSDRAAYSTEFASLQNTISQIATRRINGQSLFNGAHVSVTTDGDGGSMKLPSINFSAGDYSALTKSSTSIATADSSSKALSIVKAASNQLAGDRASIASTQATLSATENRLTNTRQEFSEARSRITNVNMATQATEHAMAVMKFQLSTAILAQANMRPSSVLTLTQ